MQKHQTWNSHSLTHKSRPISLESIYCIMEATILTYCNDKHIASIGNWINLKDLMIWGISNFRSQVGEWGRGSHCPRDEKKALWEETVGEGRSVSWGEDRHTKLMMVLIHISWDDVLGARPQNGQPLLVIMGSSSAWYGRWFSSQLASVCL